MEQLYNKLVEVIEEEAECLERFLELLADQQRCLVENDVVQLKTGVERQQELIARVKHLERVRFEIVARFSSASNLDPQEVTLTSLAQRVGGQMAERLTALQKALLSLCRKIDRAKRKNQFLMEHSMKYIQGTIRLLAEKGRLKPDYSPREYQDSVIVSKTV